MNCNYKKLSFTLVMLALTIFPAKSQWEKTASVNGGVIASIAVSENMIVAGTQQGFVFRSDDDGTTWKRIMSPDFMIHTYEPVGHLNSCAINDSGIYVDYLAFGMEWATLNLLFSGDESEGWYEIPYAFPHSYISARAVCGNTLFAAVVPDTTMVYMSTDNGWNWSKIAYDLNGSEVRSMAVADSTIIISVVDSDGCMSTDYGATWKAFITELDNIELLSIVECGENILVATRNGILKSKDNGTTWMYDSVEITPFTGLAVKDDMLFASTGKGLYRSIDEGKTWDAGNNGFNNPYITTVAVSKNMLFAGTNGDGVYRSSDNGATWESVHAGMNIELYSTLSTQGSMVFAGIPYGGIFFSNDNGVSWRTGNSGTLLLNEIQCMTTNKKTVFAGTDHSGMFRSVDSGKTWSTANNGIPSRYVGTEWFSTDIHVIAANDSSIVFSSIGEGIFSSLDNGVSWMHTDSAFYFTGLFSTATEDGPLFIGSNYNQCYLSIDHGRSWKSGTAVPSLYGLVWSVVAVKSSIYAGTDSGVVCSPDSLTSWTDCNTGLPQTRVSKLTVAGSTLFAGTDSGCFYFDDSGGRWNALSTGLPSGYISSFVANDSMLFIATKEEIFRHPLPTIAAITDRQRRKNTVRCKMPELNVSCNSSTCIAISFSCMQANHLTLSIYNLQGCLVKTLADRYFKPGKYNFFWNPTHVSSGNYCVKVSAGKNMVTEYLTVLQ